MRYRTLALAAVTVMAACSSEDKGQPTDSGTEDTLPDTITDTPTHPTSLLVKSAKSEGDFKMSGQLGLDVDGRLTVTLAAIRDPDDATRPADPSKVRFGVTGQAAAPLTCSIAKVSSSQNAMADIAFINDTTGSMSGTVKGISASVQKFAEDLVAGGIDARYSMYTYGDAFATKLESGSTFVIGKGDFAPPPVDDVERPYVGLSELSTFKGFLGELNACDCLGDGGGDGQENTLGALQWANAKIKWRDGAARYFVAIGDNPAHQPGDSLNIPSPWTPPMGDDLLGELGGSAVVHVVAKDTGSSPYYNLKKLADGTGGVFLQLPSGGNVDLDKLNLKEWLTTSFRGLCTDEQGGTYDIVIHGQIDGSKIYKATLTFAVELK